MSAGSGVNRTDDGLISFTVFGEARPAGSKRGFVNPKTGGVIITDSSGKKGKTWRSDIQAAAREVYDGPLLDKPLWVRFTFYMKRPRSHYGTGKNSDRLKPSAPLYPTTRPDVLKLTRAAEDALTGIIWRDDSLIVDEPLRKVYAEDDKPRLLVEVGAM